jgi:hypothetical protein
MVKVLVGISKAKKASSSSSGVALQTRISPFICLSEFIQLLIGRVAPRLVTFSHEELNMLFSGQIPSALLQLQGVVDGVKECGSVFKVRREGSTSLCPSEYGLYFQDAQGRDAFWFGVWTLFWTEHRFPLCFGVAERWGPEVMEAFLRTYKGPTRQFKHGYTVGWIDQQTMAGGNAVNAVWSVLAPVIEATVAAGSGRASPLGSDV